MYTGTYIDDIAVGDIIEVKSDNYIAYGYFTGEKIYNVNVFFIDINGDKHFVLHATYERQPTKQDLLNYINFIKDKKYLELTKNN